MDETQWIIDRISTGSYSEPIFRPGRGGSWIIKNACGEVLYLVLDRRGYQNGDLRLRWSKQLELFLLNGGPHGRLYADQEIS